MSPQKISCVIHTYNSEIYLSECLESLKWVDEVVVVDMHSTDATREIAGRYGAKVVLHENIGFADPARSFGLSQCSHDWILAADSDEIFPPGLKDELREISKNDKADVVYLSFRNFFFGRELRGSGWSYKDIYVPRFFKRGMLTYGSEVHHFINVSENARKLKLIDKNLAVVHFNYDSVAHFIQKLNRYTDFEAVKNRLYCGSPYGRMFYHFVREFFGRFFVKKGYLDGWLGLYLSLSMAFYRWTAIAKKRLPTEKEAQKIYKNIVVSMQGSEKK